MRDKILKIIQDSIDISDEIENINEDENLEVYGLNSLNAIKIIVNLETEFGFEFNEENLLMETIQTIKKIEDFVRTNTL